MKKLVYSLAVLFSVALVSCGGNKAEDKDSANDTTFENAAPDSAAQDSANANQLPAGDSAVNDSAAADYTK